MTDYLWPPDIIPASQTWGVIGNVSSFQSSPLSGAVRTVSRPGARLKCTITMPPVRNTTDKAERARLIGVLSGLRDRSNRMWVPDFSTTQRGSFPAPELLTNNTFESATGWTGSNMSVTATDRVLRCAVAGTGTREVYQNVTVEQYVAYALRTFSQDGRGTAGLSIGPYFDDGIASSFDVSTSRGMRTASKVSLNSGSRKAAAVFLSSTTGYGQGDYLDLHYASMARCGLIDNGPNALTYSDQFDNAAWTKTRASISANAAVAPDGTTTADQLTEDSTAANNHFAVQNATVSSAAADFCFVVAIAANTRTFANIQLIENTGSSSAEVSINLSSGAINTPTAATNWANPRAFAVPMGGGYFALALVARKTNAATSISARVYVSNALGTYAYSGDGTSGIRLWRATLAQSSVPVRLTQTTTTATTGTSQTGTGIYVKGLPASTSGLAKVGDRVQIGDQMNIVTAPLDSDAAGLGYLQLANPVRVSPSDNAPVIFNTPMCVMRMVDDQIDWETVAGQFSAFQVELVEDVA